MYFLVGCQATSDFQMAAAKTNIFAVISLFQLIGCVNIDFELTRSLAPFSTTAEPETLTSLNAIVSDLLARVASLEAFVKSESKENKLNGFNTKPATLPPCHKFGFEFPASISL